MPGSQHEVENAIEEGVDFHWLSLPVEFVGNERIKQTKIIKMQLGSADDSGRRKAEPINGSEEDLDTDLIIEALGFEPENLPIMFNKSELSVTQWGTLKINYKTMMTNIEGVFAAGDIVRGGSLVVWGIKDGRDVAENIHNFLLKKEKLLIYVVNENEKEFVHA
jgi:glutamate synthase (NADPH/NADH) small chain